MKIEEAQYQKHISDNKVNSSKCKIDGVESYVPLSEDNRHYAEILKQVKEKKLTIKEAD